jgi:WD40 repeat protein
LLLAGGGRGAKEGKTVVYDVKTGKRLSEAGDEIDVVLAADISPDHKRIALGGPQRVVRVFSVADGAPLYELRKHTDWILAAEFSPDGQFLATADRSGGVRVWEADTGTEYLNLEAHKAAATALGWRDDAKALMTAGEDGAVKFWDVVEGKALRTVAAHPPGASFAAIAHDGRVVSCGRDKLVKLLDPAGKPPRNFGPMNDIVLRCAVSHDGKRILGGDFTGEIRVFNVDDGKPLGTLAANPAGK